LEAEVYLTLYAEPHHRGTAPELIETLSKPSSSVYRALENLKRYGFITSVHFIGSAIVEARPLDHALISYAEYQRHQVRDILADQLTTQQQERRTT